jgi:hypothetical protein
MLEITHMGRKLFIELEFPFLWIGVTMDNLNTLGITDCQIQRLNIYFIASFLNLFSVATPKMV